MKKLVLLYFLIYTSSLLAQSDYELAKATVMDYIEGTANGQKERLKRAFHPDAALHSVDKDGSMKIIPIEKYISWFTEGKKSNRPGQIISLDVVNNAASAIVEVDMPGRKMKYTDYILLLKLEGKWKIFNKSYTRIDFERKGKILFVVSNKSSYGDSEARTGAHYGEIVAPYHKFFNAGYEIDFVSPEGGAIPVAYINLQNELQKKYFYDNKLQNKLKHTLAPSEVKSKDYKAIYFAGGSAAMYDLPENDEIIALSNTIYEEQNGVIGAVCHGVAGLVNVKLSSGKYLIDGKKINSYTNAEEELSGKKDLLPFMLESKLKERGGKFQKSGKWKAHVAVDGRLVTGQNPASCDLLVKEMLKIIERKEN